MNTIQKTLLKEIAFQLFHKGEKQTITKEVVKEARIQALSSLITDDFQVISNNIRVSAAHSELTEVLGDTPFVTIKGFASAYYYSDPIKCICRSQNRSCTDLKPHFNGYKTAPLPLVNRTKE